MEPTTATPTATDMIEDIERGAHAAIADAANALLDDYYDRHPGADAFGASYDAPAGVPDGEYYLGREHGADGAESDVGVDFFYRRFRDPETGGRENEYVHGKYGWADINTLLDDAGLIRQVFAEAVEDDYLDAAALDAYDRAIDAARADLRDHRERFDLGDIADLMRRHEMDDLRALLGHGDEESRTIWQLLFSKDESGDHIENPIEIPLIDESASLMFARTERYYYDEREGDGKWYAYGAVIGYDDTPERFFVHRLSSDPDLRDDDTEWTTALVKEKMGFDSNLREVGDDLPLERRVRVQGDLTLVRHDLDDERERERDRRFDEAADRMASDHAEAFNAAHPEYDDIEGLHTSNHSLRFSLRGLDTDGIRRVQEEIDMAEETVRDEQDCRGYSRLTAKRRREIVEDLCERRVREWVFENFDTEPSAAALRAETDAEVDADFAAERPQLNDVIGNHTLLFSGATEHPHRRYGDDETRGAFVVEDEATLFVIHDEHADKRLALGPGVYEARFLQGYEDEWWM